MSLQFFSDFLLLHLKCDTVEVCPQAFQNAKAVYSGVVRISLVVYTFSFFRPIQKETVTVLRGQF